MEKIFLDSLSADGVTVRKVMINENGNVTGEIWRAAYPNSLDGRRRLDGDIEEPYKTIIFMMWGNEPTINEEG